MWTTILPVLNFALPFIGKLLLMIPFVPNKLIPFILGALNVAQKYWLLMGFPATVVGYTHGGSHFALMAMGATGVVGVAWGILEQFLWHQWYEGRKAAAAKDGGKSWWEQGKASIYGKK